MNLHTVDEAKEILCSFKEFKEPILCIAASLALTVRSRRTLETLESHKVMGSLSNAKRGNAGSHSKLPGQRRLWLAMNYLQ